MSLSLQNANVAAGHRPVPQIKVTGLNIVRDFCYKIMKINTRHFRGNNRKFCLNAPSATLVNLILPCQGNRQMILIPEIIRMIQVNMRCIMYTLVDVFSRCLGRLFRFLPNLIGSYNPTLFNIWKFNLCL